MALVDPERFAQKEIARVYIAGRLREAREVERVLTERGIDYAIEIEPFHTRLLGIFHREYDGVAFYVLSADGEASRSALREARLTEGLVEEDPD